MINAENSNWCCSRRVVTKRLFISLPSGCHLRLQRWLPCVKWQRSRISLNQPIVLFMTSISFLWSQTNRALRFSSNSSRWQWPQFDVSIQTKWSHNVYLRICLTGRHYLLWLGMIMALLMSLTVRDYVRYDTSIPTSRCLP